MIPFWQSKHDDYYTIGCLHFIRFSKLVFPLISLLWKLRIQGQAHMHGRVYSEVEMSYKGVLDDELGMGIQ